MITPMLKFRFLAVATLVLNLANACTTSSPPSGPSAGSAAKSGSGGKAGKGGSGGKGGSSGNPSSRDAGDPDGAAQSGGTGGRAGSLSSGSGGRAGGAGTGGTGNVAGGGPDLSAELFDPDRLQVFEITLPQASITALGTAPDTYTHAALKYGDTTLPDVAIRIKGESSRRTLEQKAAFKIKLDEYVGKQTLLGMKRITLNNMLADATFMSECLSYYMYRKANLPAPRCNHALVYVNGTLFGVYANIEAEDKTFLSRWFSSNDGNLYEDAEVDFSVGNEALFDLQTNETANNRSDLTALINALDAAQSASYLSDLDAVLDTTHFLRFSAVEAAVNQWDGYSYTYFEPNNFRLYHDPSSGKFTFLPWGHDLAMKAFEIDPDGPKDVGMLDFIPLFKVPVYQNRTGERAAGGRIFVGDRNNVAHVGCLDSQSCKTEYASVLRDVIALYDSANLDTRAAEMYALIKAHVLEDGRKEVTNAQFETAYQNLLQHIATRTQAMRDDMTAAGFP
jgi:hypothetical protein